MEKLRVIKSSPLATIQDKGRFGHRRYGIPQSGAMDPVSMEKANDSVGNPNGNPVVEFALMGLTLEALADVTFGVAGSDFKVNSTPSDSNSASISKGDILEILPPYGVYAYLAIAGLIESNQVLGSYSTYLLGRFGGLDGRSLKSGDILCSSEEGRLQSSFIAKETQDKIVEINCLKGPEWNFMEDQINEWTFKIDPASNRMGIRLSGNSMPLSFSEIDSSAVVPGIIQVPSSGQPVVLMNDCQTTGGYPRVGKVTEIDLPKLAQVKPNNEIKLIFE